MATGWHEFATHEYARVHFISKVWVIAGDWGVFSPTITAVEIGGGLTFESTYSLEEGHKHTPKELRHKHFRKR